MIPRHTRPIASHMDAAIYLWRKEQVASEINADRRKHRGDR